MPRPRRRERELARLYHQHEMGNIIRAAQKAPAYSLMGLLKAEQGIQTHNREIQKYSGDRAYRKQMEEINVFLARLSILEAEERQRQELAEKNSPLALQTAKRHLIKIKKAINQAKAEFGEQSRQVAIGELVRTTIDMELLQIEFQNNKHKNAAQSRKIDEQFKFLTAEAHGLLKTLGLK